MAKKVQCSIVNCVVMHEAPHTQQDTLSNQAVFYRLMREDLRGLLEQFFMSLIA